MPKAVEDCKTKLMKDPKFKPRDPNQTKEDAAWAVCQSLHKEGKLSEGMEILPIYFTEYFFEPPESGDLPAEGKKVLAEAYSNCRSKWVKDHPDDKENADNKTSCSKQSWTAVHNAGYKNKDGHWTKFRDDNEKVSFIPFNEISSPEIILQKDGTAIIKNLAFFELGNHKGFDYDQVWADNAISYFKEQKDKKGFRPPAFVSHQSQGGTKPVKGFMEDIRQEGNVFYADLIKVPQDIIRDYPYRSVEIRGEKHTISGLAFLGADEIPYFHFEPTVFNDQEEDKTILTFKAEGGESMSTFEFAQEDRNLLKGILDGVSKFFSFKKQDDPPGDKKTFTEDEVKKREDALKTQVKTETEKIQQMQFAETEKKKDQAEMMKILFATKDQKEGLFLAPRLKSKVEAVFAKLDNLEKIKFSESGADGKDVEKESTAYGLLREIFSELMTKPDVWVPLGEKARYFEAVKPAGTGNDKVTLEESEEIAKAVVAKFGTRRKKEEEKK